MITKHDERQILLAGHTAWVSRLVKDGHDQGFMIKIVEGSRVKEYFSENGETFLPMTSSILDSGMLQKNIFTEPESSEARVLLLRQVLSEWMKDSKDYETQIYSFDPVAIRLRQRHVNAPGHAHWGCVTCEMCDATFAIGYNRIFGDKAAEVRTVQKLREKLSDDHLRQAMHLDAYELG
jgi:hypothetical protein